MAVLALRIAALLLLAFALVGLALLLAGGDDPMPARLVLTGATLVLAWVLLLPLAQRLAERSASADRLAERVAELERQLARAGTQRQELLTNLSHDLRTPLASMQGYLELLLLRQDALEPAEAQNYLQTAVRHSERLSRLVDDLFELTRLEAEGLQLQAEPFPVAELAHDVAQRFAAAAERAHVALAVQAAEGGALLVQAEVALVERVLGNLVDNALRHTPCGGRVTIEVGAEDGAARVCVADTGAGMEGADLEGVFDRYETAPRTGDTGSSRAGLGLAIARRIAALHGSGLELDSRPGEGTRVSFRLPQAARRAGI